MMPVRRMGNDCRCDGAHRRDASQPRSIAGAAGKREVAATGACPDKVNSATACAR